MTVDLSDKCLLFVADYLKLMLLDSRTVFRELSVVHTLTVFTVLAKAFYCVTANVFTAEKVLPGFLSSVCYAIYCKRENMYIKL